MKLLLPLSVLLVPVLLCACDEKSAGSSPPPISNTAADLVGAFLVTSDFAAEAKPIPELKKTAKVGDTVVIRGRIGGSEHPFVDGAAVFTVVDVAEPITCGPADPCPTKWDYCCADPAERVRASATVKFMQGDKLVMGSVKGYPGISEFCLLTVKGKVLLVDDKNLVVAPDAIFNAGEDGDGKKAGTLVREGK